MEFRDYADREMLAMDLAGALASELSTHLMHEERVVFAVPGGSTPGPVFDQLCAADLDWARVDVVLTDERWVAESSPRSNTALLRERLLVDKARDANLLPLYLEGQSLEDSLPKIAAMLEPRLPVSVALLGMGGDMHTASLFPDSPELEAALDDDAPVVLGVTSPSQPEKRVTLTASVLGGAVSTHLLIAGQDKRDALEKARHLSPQEAPIAKFLDGLVVHWAA